MNAPFLLRGLFVGFGCLLALPFYVLATVFRWVFLLVGWLVSFATVLLAFAMIVVAFVFLVAGPFRQSHDVSQFRQEVRAMRDNARAMGERIRSEITADPDFEPIFDEAFPGHDHPTIREFDGDNGIPVWKEGQGWRVVSPSGRVARVYRDGNVRRFQLTLRGPRRGSSTGPVEAEVNSDRAFAIAASAIGALAKADALNELDAEACDEESDCSATAESDGDSSQVEPSQVEPSQVEPSQVEPNRDRPAWVDEVVQSDGKVDRVVAECGPTETREACEDDFDEAVRSAVEDYVRDRTKARMQELHCNFLPWHERFVQRLAEDLNLDPSDVYLDEHTTKLGDEESADFFFKYGLLEFTPAVQGAIDRQVTQWARSFQVGSIWSVALASLGSVYLVLRSGFLSTWSSRPFWQRGLGMAAIVGTGAVAVSAVASQFIS